MRPSRWARSSPIAASPLRSLVFLVTWISNLAGAGLRLSGGAPLRSPAVRQPYRPPPARPRSLAVIEREYLRFGIAGIFISRFLPGISAVVPPFAGLVRLGAVRTFVPMALASAIWYGGITLVGSLIGANWDADRRHPREREPDDGHHHRWSWLPSGAAWYWASRRRRAAGAGLARNPGRTRPRGAVVPAGNRHRRRIRPGGGGAAGARAGLCRSGAHTRGPRAGRRTPARALGPRVRPVAVADAGARGGAPHPVRALRRPAPDNVSGGRSGWTWSSGCGPSRSATAPSAPRRTG